MIMSIPVLYRTLWDNPVKTGCLAVRATSEADAVLGWDDLRRFEQLLDGVEDDLDLFIVLAILALQRLDLRRQFVMGRHDFAQTDKGAHNGNVDLDGSLTAEHGREHG